MKIKLSNKIQINANTRLFDVDMVNVSKMEFESLDGLKKWVIWLAIILLCNLLAF